EPIGKGPEESAVACKRSAVTRGDRAFHGLFVVMRQHLHATDEYACGIGWRGAHLEWQHPVDDAARHDVEHSRAVLEPQVTPGVEHRGGFASEEPRTHQQPLELDANLRECCI